MAAFSEAPVVEEKETVPVAVDKTVRKKSNILAGLARHSVAVGSVLLPSLASTGGPWLSSSVLPLFSPLACMVGIGVVWANLNNTVDDLKQTQRELADRFDREALDRKERQKIYQVTMDG